MTESKLETSGGIEAQHGTPERNSPACGFFRTAGFSIAFQIPAFDPRKSKRCRRKFRSSAAATPYKRMNFRTTSKRFNPWVFNKSKFVYKPACKL